MVGDVIEGDYDGVKYRTLDSIHKNYSNCHFHCLIAASYLCFLEEFKNFSFSKSFFCIHNTESTGGWWFDGWRGGSLEGQGLSLLESPRLTNIVCLTQWHKDSFCKSFPTLDNKVKIIGNAIDTSSLPPIKEKTPFSFIYSSHPERGLEFLLQNWSKLRKHIPTATLKVCTPDYGISHFNQIKQKTLSNWKDNLNWIGVDFVGAVSQKELHNILSSTDYWIYPTSYEETYCITALEMQAMRVCCITSRVAALQDTVSNRGILIEPEHENDDDLFFQFISNIIYLEGTQHDKLKLLDRAQKWAYDQSWEKRALEWVNLIEFN